MAEEEHSRNGRKKSVLDSGSDFRSNTSSSYQANEGKNSKVLDSIKNTISKKASGSLASVNEDEEDDYDPNEALPTDRPLLT